ncbi:MAG: hypothetical protein WD119_00230 [Pirellulaceae bacterium]
MNRVSPSIIPMLLGLFVPLAIAISISVGVQPSLDAADALRKQASWQTPQAEASVAILVDALQQQGVEPEQIETIAAGYSDALSQTGSDSLAAFITAAAKAVPAIEEIQQAAEASPTSVDSRMFAPLKKPLQMAAKLYVARELVRQRFYDEALPLLEEVEPGATVDPAAALFYRATCHHALLNKKEVLADLRTLLGNRSDAPVRFVRTAQLMLADIKPLEEDSLDEISRLMTGVNRHLELGRASQKVLDQEQTIIDKLSKLIDEIEEQQQQQQQQQQASGGGQSQGDGKAQGMDDSRIAGASGDGDVDQKQWDDRDKWGDLPPAERQEALQQISRDLPTHYRDAIEAYFRKLATDE